MKPLPVILLMALPAAAAAGTSASYTLTPEAVDQGGGLAGSAAYTVNVSQGPGGAGGSAAYTSRTGFAGQLDEAASLQILLEPAAMAETGTAQLRARLLSPEGTVTELTPGNVTWSILGGPLSGITPGGLVTAAPVYQNTTATVRGVFSGLDGILTFPVLETIPDNFGLYAGDRLPDDWQVRYLGLAEPAGGQTGDPDADSYNNLLEFAFGTDPGDPGSGSGEMIYAGGQLLARGQPVLPVTNLPNGVDFRVVFPRRRDYQAVGLRYQVQFSSDLQSWTTSATVPTVLAGDAEYEAVSVPWPLFINGRKIRFHRMLIDFTPAP